MPRWIFSTSGKGGVGKSMIAANLALKLVDKGYRVGACDCDIWGPNLDILFNVRGSIPLREESNKLIPPEITVKGRKLWFISMALFIPPEVGFTIPYEQLSEAVKTMMSYVKWDDSDFIIVDFPPGTPDVVNHAISLVSGDAILVMEPTKQSYSTCMRLYDVLKLGKVDVLAIVANKYNLFPANNDYIKRMESIAEVIKIPWDEDLIDSVYPEKPYFEKLANIVLGK